MKPCLMLLSILVANGAVAQQSLPSLMHPPQNPELFASGFFSTSLNERDFALAPDGSEIFFTLSHPKYSLIMRSTKTMNGQWTEPVVASFSGEFNDLEAAISPDGKTLYFASNRPLEGSQSKDFDIWKVEKTGKDWGEPTHLGNVVNTAGNEFYPSVGESGNLYFTASRDNGIGSEDIFVSVFRNGEYEEPQPLDSAINTSTYEFNAFVSPEEKYIIFGSFGREDDHGGGDLYISVKDDQGQWKDAVNLEILNTSSLDYCPFVSPDGNVLFFTSEHHNMPDSLPAGTTRQTLKALGEQTLNGSGNIYWVDFSRIIKEPGQ